MSDEVIGATDHPDGTREEFTESIVRILNSVGELIGERPLSDEERQRVQEVLDERAIQNREQQASSELWEAAVAAYNRNDAFIAAVPTATYPLPVEQQQYLVATVADLASTVNGLLRLLDNKGLIS